MLVVKIYKDESLVYEVHAMKLLYKTEAGNDLYEIVDPGGYNQEIAEFHDRPISSLVSKVFNIIRQEDEATRYREEEKEEKKKNKAKHLLKFNLIKQYVITNTEGKLVAPELSVLKLLAPDKNDTELHALFHSIRGEIKYHNALCDDNDWGTEDDDFMNQTQIDEEASQLEWEEWQVLEQAKAKAK
jgi:hypothetical protein